MQASASDIFSIFEISITIYMYYLYDKIIVKILLLSLVEQKGFHLSNWLDIDQR